MQFPPFSGYSQGRRAHSNREDNRISFPFFQLCDGNLFEINLYLTSCNSTIDRPFIFSENATGAMRNSVNSSFILALVSLSAFLQLANKASKLDTAIIMSYIKL